MSVTLIDGDLPPDLAHALRTAGRVAVDTETLSDEQISYATADVAYLLDLHDVLSKRLDVNGMSELFARVCAYMPVDAHLAVLGIPDPLAY